MKKNNKPMTNKDVLLSIFGYFVLSLLILLFLVYSPITLRGMSSLVEDIGKVNVVVFGTLILTIISSIQTLHKKKQSLKVSSVDEQNNNLDK